MSKLPLISLILSLAACAGVGYLLQPSPAHQKLGFVRTGVLLEQCEISAETRKKIQDEQEEVRENVKALEDSLTKNHEAFLAEQADLDKDSRMKRMEELAEQEQELNRYRSAAMKTVQSREEELMGPVLQIINARIKRFAEKEGITMIWGTLNEGNILYGTEALDVTDELVTYINSKK